MAHPSSPKIVELRQMLEAQRQKHLAPASTWSCGNAFLDSLQIPQAALSEIVANPFLSPGGGTFLQHLLQSSLPRQRVVLIDSKNSFDPSAFSQPLLERLLWLRCDDSFQAVKAADLILRDGNISLALFSCLLNPERELKKIQAQSWHRLQLLAEKSAITFLAFTPCPLITSARLRLALALPSTLPDLDQLPEKLLSRIHMETIRRRSFTPENSPRPEPELKTA